HARRDGEVHLLRAADQRGAPRGEARAARAARRRGRDRLPGRLPGAGDRLRRPPGPGERGLPPAGRAAPVRPARGARDAAAYDLPRAREEPGCRAVAEPRVPLDERQTLATVTDRISAVALERRTSR